MKRYCAILTAILPLVASMPPTGLKESQKEDITKLNDNAKYYGGGYGGNAGGGYNPGNVIFYYPGDGNYYPVYPGSPGGGYPAYPGGFGGYNPNGGRGNPYPGQPGPGGNGPEERDEDGKIPNAVPVDDEVEVFNVPGSNPGQGGYPGGSYPRNYPGYYPGQG